MVARWVWRRDAPPHGMGNKKKHMAESGKGGGGAQRWVTAARSVSPVGDYHFCIDYESCHARMERSWLAFCAVVVHYPSGVVCERLDGYVTRPLSEYDLPRQTFWSQRFPRAHRYIEDQARQLNRPAEEQELALVGFARAMHDKYPHLRLLSDNPTFDLGLLNTWLERYGRPSMMHGQRGNYVHPYCLHTGRLLMRALRCSVTAVPVRPVEQVANNRDLAHTPWYDVCKLVTEAFRQFDVITTQCPGGPL